jgi:tetratricopeptide (TPR) repeat protein
MFAPARFPFLVILAAFSVLSQTPLQVEQSEKGAALMAAGKFEEAVPIYRHLSQTMPGNPGWLLNLGMALQLAGHARQAIPPLEKTIAVDPKIAPAWLFLGASYLGAGEPKQAITPLKKFIRLQPDDPGGHQTLGNALLATEAYLDAVAEFQKVSDLEPENPHAWYGLNRCYRALSQFDFKAIEQAAPASAWWLALVADERVFRQQFQSAFFFYRKAESIRPDLAGLHSSIAEVYKASDHADWAEAEARKEVPPDCTASPLACKFNAGDYYDVIAQAASTPEALYWRSRAYAMLARNARERLQKLPESPEAHEVQAETLQVRRQPKEAAEELKLALKLAPSDTHLREELLSALFQARDYQGALSLVDELLKDDPASPPLSLTKGYVLLALEDPEKAMPYLKAAFKANPKSIEVHAALGRAYVQMKQPTAAIPHLSAALPSDSDGSLRYELARAYQASGETELARKEMAEYQARTKADREEKDKLEQELQITAP